MPILRNSPENRARLFKCTSCEQMRPGSLFYCLTEKPALKGKTTTHLDNIGKVLTPYSRTPWRTRAIDTERPCSACRQRASARASAQRAKERTEQLREEALAYHIRKNLPVPAHLVKNRKVKGAGPDPVLQAVNAALALTRKQIAEALLAQEKEGVVGAAAGSVGISNAVHPFYKWLFRLLDARLALYESIRDKRKLDLQSPFTANDAQRFHMRAYVTPADHATLDWIAAKVNRYRPARQGKPYIGVPIINLPRPMGDHYQTDGQKAQALEREARAVALLKEAWAPFKEAISLTLRASRSAVRDKHRAQANHRTLRYGTSDEKFTMEQYHMKRIECGEAAKREIERCIVHNIHPQAWRSPYTDEVRALRTWGPLVPPLLKEELRAMWVVLPEVVQNRARPFPMLRAKMKGALNFQRAKVLTAAGLPLSDKLATEYEVEA